MAMVVTGAKAVIKLQGRALAFAAGVSVQHENRLEEIPQLDSLEVAEYAESGHRCSVTLNLIKISIDKTINNRPDLNSGRVFGFDDPHDLRTILLQPELMIEIMDVDVTGAETPIYIAQGCKFAGGSGQVDAGGVWKGSWTFKGRRGSGI